VLLQEDLGLDGAVAVTGDAALGDRTAVDGAHFDGATDGSGFDGEGNESSDGTAVDGAHFDGAADGSAFDAEGNESGDSMGTDASMGSSNCPAVAPFMGSSCAGVPPGTPCAYFPGQTCVCQLQSNSWFCGPSSPPFDAGSCPPQPSPAESCAIPGQPPCAYSNNVNCFCVFDPEGGAGRWNCL
jgi:hypothetical protein